MEMRWTPNIKRGLLGVVILIAILVVPFKIYGANGRFDIDSIMFQILWDLSESSMSFQFLPRPNYLLPSLLICAPCILWLSKAPNLAVDETCSPLGNKLKTIEKVGSEYGLSKNSIARYLRVNKLNSNLKDLVDEGKIAMRAGVDLSYLTNDSQEMVEAIISENTFKVDMKKASTLRAFDKSGKLTWEKIQPQIISKYFRPNENKKDIEKVIDKALEMYFTRIKEAEIIEDEDEEEIG